MPKKLTQDQQLLEDCHFAMKSAIEDWNLPDSPESFCFSMKGLMVMRDRIAARLGMNQDHEATKTINQS